MEDSRQQSGCVEQWGTHGKDTREDGRRATEEASNKKQATEEAINNKAWGVQFVHASQ